DIDMIIIYYFFFSSRRRHTRSKRDWSSDVCSSDLAVLETVLVVVLLEPPRTDPEDQAPLRDVIHRAGHVRQQVGVPVAVAGHQRTDLHPRGGLGPGTQHGPTLEVLTLRISGQRVEVVPVEQHVDSEFL